ncbi:MAG TPA: NAD(P)/FAD-dependent oxidoreductase [Bradyrhizobium sp.]|nr:NAD(P)/FAD-dependent oxidoreductase [Bradyrhizobium sp.]
MRILILGAGFAGLWAAIGAARKLDEMGMKAAADILIVDRNPYHNIRVRNYEADLSDVAIPLSEVLDPIGVGHIAAEVEAIDTTNQEVAIATADSRQRLSYDRLVLALGSELVRPPIPGLAAHGFDVDTYAAAVRLDAHLAKLATLAASPACSTVVIVGAGFTGIEVATELPNRLAQAGITHPRIILVDPSPVVGATIGDEARPVINEALAALHIETRLGVMVTAVHADGIILSSEEFIPSMTVVWCGGMAANALTAEIASQHDRHGRLVVDQFMRATGLKNVFAAGDIASCAIDGTHSTVMSCQFARPMGRFAGHNVVADLFGQPMLRLNIDWYVTVLDLGGWGALYTVGWDRRVQSTGAAAKATKNVINRQRIYPPRTASRADILAAAAPTIQAPPGVRSKS